MLQRASTQAVTVWTFRAI